MPPILSIVLWISYVRRTRIKLHFRIQYVSDKSRKHLRNMQQHCPSFGIVAMQISRKQSFQPIANRLESELCYSQIREKHIVRTTPAISPDTNTCCPTAHADKSKTATPTAHTKKGLWNLRFKDLCFPELLTRIELVTSSLPRKCSTTELQQHSPFGYLQKRDKSNDRFSIFQTSRQKIVRSTEKYPSDACPCPSG